MQIGRPLLFSLLIALGCILPARAQEDVPEKTKPQQAPMGGVSTGVAHAAQKDAQSRPITAGGFVDSAPVVFTDITKQAGLDKFHHRSGTPEKKSIIETPGSGVALLDYDNDGWLDIYLLNGSTIPALKGKEPPPRAMLFHNNHDGTFTDVTAKAGVANERGVLVWQSVTTITMAGPISTSPTTARIVSITIIMTAHLLTLQKRLVSRWVAGLLDQPGATTTAMGCLIYLSRAM